MPTEIYRGAGDVSMSAVKQECHKMSFSSVARGGAWGVQPPPPPIRIEAVFFHSRKVTVIKYYNLSLTTRRTINSHDLRKTNHFFLGGGCDC